MPLLARVPAAPGALRPAPRARRLRRGLRRHPHRRGQPRHRGQGAHRPAQPRPPRRRRRRGQLRRRRRHPDAGPRRVPARRCVDFELPPPGTYAVGTAFLPGDDEPSPRPAAGSRRSPTRRASPSSAGATYRSTPSSLGATARGVMPPFSPAVRRRPPAPGSPGWRWSGSRSACASAPSTRPTSTSRRCRRAPWPTRACSPPTSSTTFFPDLADERVASALAVVHSRFSTNTFPSWPLAHPFRFIAHNGEINTVMGNRNWMRAREALLDSDLIPGDLERLFPICTPGASDSASLRRGARAAAHGRPLAAPLGADDDPGGVGEPPRDGPEAPGLLRVPLLADGAVGRPRLRGLHRRLPDRRGPRPQRPAPLPLLGHRRRPRRARLRGRRARPRPGHDRPQGPAAAGPDVPRRHRGAPDHRGRRDQGRARRRAPVRRVAARRPDPPRRHPRARARRPHPRARSPGASRSSATPRRSCGSCSPRWPTAAPSRSARWAPTPRSRRSATSRGCCSTTSRSCSRRSPTRRWTRSARSWSPRWPAPSARRPTCSSPTPGVVPPGRAAVPGARQRRPGQDPAHQPRRRHARASSPTSVRGLYDVEGGGEAMARRIDEICAEVSEAIAGGARIIVLSDRHSTAELAPIPSLLLTGAVHHHLVREKTRTQVGLLVEAGDVREVHHVALLIGYGAAAVNPYLAMESVEDLARDGYYVKVEPEKAVAQPDQGARQGRAQGDVARWASPRSRPTPARRSSRRSACRRPWSTGTSPAPPPSSAASSLDVIAEEVARRHATAYPRGGIAPAHRELRDRRRVPVAPRGRAAPVRPRDGLPAPALHPQPALRRLQAVHRAASTSSPSG